MTPATSESGLTGLATTASAPNKGAFNRLFAHIYNDFRDLARSFLAREAHAHTLQPTALVNEAYLQLARQSQVDWKSRSHLLAVGAIAMLRILVNRAIAARRDKRGGVAARVTLNENLVCVESNAEVLAVNQALRDVAELNERHATLVELRFFGGLSVAEIAGPMPVGDLSAVAAHPLSGHNDLTGRKISHYRVLAPMDQGAMGILYRATETRLERIVALKFLPPALTPNPASRERFAREAKAIASIGHQNVCPVYEIDEADELVFIAMACLDGAILDEKLQHGALPPGEAVEIALQTARGLQAAHAKGIVHRDIKPANLMFGFHSLPPVQVPYDGRNLSVSQHRWSPGRCGETRWNQVRLPVLPAIELRNIGGKKP